MAIRIPRSQVQPRPVQRQVVAPSGDRALAQELRQGGQALAAIGVEIGQMLDTAAASEAEGRIKRAFYDRARSLEDGLSQTTSFRGAGELWQKEQETYEQDALEIFNKSKEGLSRNAQRRLDLWINETGPSLSESTFVRMTRAFQQQAPALLQADVDDALARGDYEGAQRMLLGNRGFLSAAEQRVMLGGIMAAEEKAKVDAIQSTILEQAQKVGFDQAVANVSDPKWIEENGYTIDQVNQASIDARQLAQVQGARREAEQKRAIETMTANLYKKAFAKDVTILQDIDAALDLGISPSVVKDLRKIATTPYADNPDYLAEQKVRDAIGQAALGIITKADALKVYGQHLDKMTAEQGGRMIALLDTDLDRSNEYWRSEATSRMEELIRDKDPFSGAFTDDQRQILAAAEASSELEAERQRAAAEGKPLIGTDLLARAIEIAQLKRIKIESERKAKIDPSYNPDENIPTGLESVWGQMSQSVKAAARRNIDRGVSPQAIIQRFRQIQDGPAE